MKQVIQHFDIIQEEMKKSNELSSQELATIFLEPCNIEVLATLCGDYTKNSCGPGAEQRIVNISKM